MRSDWNKRGMGAVGFCHACGLSILLSLCIGGTPLRAEPEAETVATEALASEAEDSAPAPEAEEEAAPLEGNDAESERAKTLFLQGDIVTAIDILRQPVIEGHVESQLLMAFILKHATDYPPAFELYKKLADAGNAEGQEGLGVMYLNGEATEKDEVEGMRLIHLAAEQGDESAILILANAYLRGSSGLEVNKEKAIEWLERGAQGGSETAGTLLNEVQGVTPSPAEVTE